MSTALLLAETEPSARSYLARHLSHDGFEVVMELGEGRRVDLALLPDVASCRHLRERAGDVPVIVLGREDADAVDRVRALQNGADDFLEQPVVYAELLARIRNILRRAAPSGGAPLEGAALRRMLRIRATSSALMLAREPSRVFTKAELLRDVWGFQSPTARTRTLDSHACRLRRKLEPGAFVINVWGVGYKLVEE